MDILFSIQWLNYCNSSLKCYHFSCETNCSVFRICDKNVLKIFIYTVKTWVKLIESIVVPNRTNKFSTVWNRMRKIILNLRASCHIALKDHIGIWLYTASDYRANSSIAWNEINSKNRIPFRYLNRMHLTAYYVRFGSFSEPHSYLTIWYEKAGKNERIKSIELCNSRKIIIKASISILVKRWNTLCSNKQNTNNTQSIRIVAGHCII